MPNIRISKEVVRIYKEMGIYDAVIFNMKKQWKDGRSGNGVTEDVLNYWGNSATKFLNDAFQYSLSPEGFSYWMDIYHKLEKL